MTSLETAVDLMMIAVGTTDVIVIAAGTTVIVLLMIIICNQSM